MQVSFEAQVRMADINGPVGGTEMQCRVVLDLREGSPVVIPALRTFAS